MGNLREKINFLEPAESVPFILSESDNFNYCVVTMGTSGGEPRFLLNALKPMLGICGDIKTPQEVLRVVGLMKDAEKLMSRCIYLNVLRATCSQSKSNGIKKDTLDRFLISGGWGILNKWLNEYSKSENVPVLIEIIEVLKCLPVTIGVLKQGNTGKVVKQLTKFDDADVRKGAMQLIKQWKGMIRGGSNEKVVKTNSKEAVEKGEESPQGTSKRQRQGSTDEKMQPPPEKKVKQGEEKQSKGKTMDSKPVAMESFGFMNAMVAVASKPVKKKKKLSVSKTTLPLDEILNNKSVNGDKSLDPPYASPMREGQDKTEDNEQDDDNEQKTKDDAEESNGDKADSLEKDSLQPPTKKSKKTKKSITWADDDNLTKVCYFELDEEELASMHHTVNFNTAKHNELIREREALENARRMGEDRMVEKAVWKRPCIIEMNPLPIEPGEKSREKYIQKEREQKVLADIFLTKASLPDAPAEPENETEDHGLPEPKLIPHDEEGTLYPKPSVPLQQAVSTAITSGSTQSTSDSTAGAKDPQAPSASSLLGDPTADMLANIKDPDVSPAVHNIMKHIMVNKPGSPQDFPRPGGPEFIGHGARPLGPEVHGFRPGHPRFPIRGGVPRPLINVYQGRPRGMFRGRPMGPRGPMRPRFHGPPMAGMQGGNEDHFDGNGGEEHFRGRGRGRGHMMRGRGKREPPLCRHFMTPTGCRNGGNCKFVHPGAGPPPR